MIIHTKENPKLEVSLPHSLDDPALTESEKEIYDRFVIEYLIDFDYLAAAIRVGYEGRIAVKMGSKFKYNTYIQRQIAEALVNRPEDPVATAESNEQRIINSLFKEANYKGPGSSHGARVSALTRLSVLCGMEKPNESRIHHDGVQEFRIKTEFDYSNLNDDQLEMVRKLLESQTDGDQSA